MKRIHSAEACPCRTCLAKTELFLLLGRAENVATCELPNALGRNSHVRFGRMIDRFCSKLIDASLTSELPSKSRGCSSLGSLRRGLDDSPQKKAPLTTNKNRVRSIPKMNSRNLTTTAKKAYLYFSRVCQPATHNWKPRCAILRKVLCSASGVVMTTNNRQIF